MIKRLIQSIVGTSKPLRNPAPETKNLLSDPKLMDIAHEVLARDAIDKKMALSLLEKHGWPYVEKQRFKELVKSKVRKLLSLPVGTTATEEMMEEITERITEAAEVDPYYSQMFDDAEKKI